LSRTNVKGLRAKTNVTGLRAKTNVTGLRAKTKRFIIKHLQTTARTMTTNLHAEDWELIWKNGINPGERFDIGTSHPVLNRLMNEGKIPLGDALVPGCGRGYDVALLSQNQRKVIGLDMSQTCVEESNKYLKSVLSDDANAKVLCEDFFDHKGSYSFVYDYTFLCAILPERRGQWAEKMASLIEKGGSLLTMQFPLSYYGTIHPKGEPLDYTRGPPFLLTKALYDDLLSDAFEKIEAADVPEEQSEIRRKGVEAYALWRRK